MQIRIKDSDGVEQAVANLSEESFAITVSDSELHLSRLGLPGHTFEIKPGDIVTITV